MTNLTYRPPGPVAKAFMQDDSFVRLIVGPLGSGKTSVCAVELLRRAGEQAPGPDGVRRFRAVIIRNTFAMLRSTTIQSWIQWCPAHYGKLNSGSPITHKITTDDLDIEVYFMPLDDENDVKKLLSLEVTMAWIDECREVPKAVLDGLTGRVGRYPSKLQGGCTWSGIVLSTNPSDQENWVYKIAQDPPEGWKVFHQPGGRTPEAENTDNLPAGYYDRIAAGKDEEWKSVYIDGQFGFTIEGRAVFTSFRDKVHVAPEPIKPVPELGLILGADWGLTPACCIGQVLPDGRLIILDEFVCFDTGIIRFAETLSAYIKRHYPNNEVVMAVGDPAGTARGQSDERTIFELMNAHTPWRWRPAQSNELTIRIEAVNLALNRMIDGKPGFQLSPTCSTLRKAFAGGYHYKKVSSANNATFHETPNKNEFSHISDALQYLALAAGAGDAALAKNRKTKDRPRMASNIDYDLFGGSDHEPSVRQRGAVVGEPTRETIFGRRRAEGASTWEDAF